MQEEIILFTFSFLFGSLLIGGLEVIKKFIQSKPPGRRLVSKIRSALRSEERHNLRVKTSQVTADIHVHQAASLQFLFGVFSLSNMIKALWNSFSFWATFTIAWLITFALGTAPTPSNITLSPSCDN